MIEVRVYHHADMQTHDTAEAETPEDALLAARTLWDEARTIIWTQHRTIQFIIDGQNVWTSTVRP